MKNHVVVPSNRPETVTPEATPLPMSGDHIIATPDVAWNTTINVSRDLDEVWSGQWGVTRMGAVGEGYAGFLFPQWLDPVLPAKHRSRPVGAPFPKQLRLGDKVPDGHKDDRAEVVELDDEAKTIVFEAQYGPKKDGKLGLHYTWQLCLQAGDTPGTTELTARTRMENVKRPNLVTKLAPNTDRFAMEIVRQGLMRDDTAPGNTELQAKHMTAAAAVGGLAARHLTKESSSNAVRVIVPIVGAAIGAIIGSKAAHGTKHSE